MKCKIQDFYHAQVLLGASRSEKLWSLEYLFEKLAKSHPTRRYVKKGMKEIKQNGLSRYSRRIVMKKTIIRFLQEYGAKSQQGKFIGISKINSNDSHYVYFVEQEGLGFIKVGVAKNVEKRITKLQTASPVKLKLLTAILVGGRNQAFFMEKAIHERLKKYRVEGEWFKCEPERIGLLLKNGNPQKWRGIIVTK